MNREVVVVSAVRTAIGTFGGSLKDIAPTKLAGQVVRESLTRSNVEGKDVGHVVFGHVVNTEAKDMYLSRVATISGDHVHRWRPSSSACRRNSVKMLTTTIETSFQMAVGYRKMLTQVNAFSLFSKDRKYATCQ